MGTRDSEGMEIVARARRLDSFGWTVEQHSEGKWIILAPSPGRGHKRPRIEVHRTPSDVNATKSIMRALNNAGFEEAEKEYLAEIERERQEAADLADQANRRKLIAASKQASNVARAAGPYGLTEVTIAELLAEHPAPRTYHRVLVTPEIAAALLERNVLNRPIRPSDVATYSTILRQGDWLFLHTGVAIDALIRLQDGQQRLTAIKETGIPAEMTISVGMDPKNFPAIDTGRRRTAAQAVSLSRGNVRSGSAAARAAAARLLYLLATWKSEMLDHLNERPTNGTIVDVSLKIDDERFDWALKAAYRLRHEKIMRSVAAPVTAFYLIASAMPPGDPKVEEFVEGLIDGVKPNNNDPIYLLRRTLVRRVGDRIQPGYQVAHIILGWNFFIEGRHVAGVPIPAEGARFPKVLTGPAK